MVARFLAKPKEDHLMAIKRILRYLKGTKDYGLWHKLGGNIDVKVFTDVDWEKNLDDRKSTSGGAFFLGKQKAKLHIPIHSRRRICCNSSELF